MSQTGIAEGSFEAAQALQAAGRWAESVEVLQPLTKTGLTLNVALALGVGLTELGRYGDAEYWLLLAARHRPAEPLARQRLGVLYAAQDRIDLAELELRTALAFQPDHGPSHLALASVLLSMGRYPEGWPHLEPRVALNPDLVPAVAVSFPEWRGEPLAGKSILVWVEQGFGDQIQMARFASLLKVRGASQVTLACRPQLARLFSTLAGVDEVMPVASGSQVSVAAHDYWSRYFSLPQHLGITLQTLPSAPYLAAPAGVRSPVEAKGGVGLVWQASPTGFNADAKGLSSAEAQQILDLGAISLHPQDTGAQDFAETAAIIADLDLVISIDTAVAHLAGAMGKPCWTLVPFLNSDWRWMRRRPDSPWYPSMQLYRQRAVGDWKPVIRRVLADLALNRAPHQKGVTP